MPDDRRKPPLYKTIAKAAHPIPTGSRRPTKSDDTYTVFFTIIMAALAVRLIIGFAGGLVGAQAVAQVGDRLVFAPASGAPPPITAQIPARLVADPWAPPGPGCTLDSLVMAHPGGAVTVIALRPDGVMLSWAGRATAPAAASCPGGQSLLVSAVDYQQLRNAQTPPHLAAK